MFPNGLVVDRLVKERVGEILRQAERDRLARLATQVRAHHSQTEAESMDIDRNPASQITTYPKGQAGQM